MTDFPTLMDCKSCPYKAEDSCAGLIRIAEAFRVPGYECWMLAEPRPDTFKIQHFDELRSELGETVEEFMAKQAHAWKEFEEEEYGKEQAQAVRQRQRRERQADKESRPAVPAEQTDLFG